jgi:hypothetical protein
MCKLLQSTVRRTVSSVSYVQQTAKSFENSSFASFPWTGFAHLLGQKVPATGFAKQKGLAELPTGHIIDINSQKAAR